MITGFAYSHGGVVTDATLPVQNINADVQSFSIGVAHAFDLFGLSSQALIAVPYSLAQIAARPEYSRLLDLGMINIEQMAPDQTSLCSTSAASKLWEALKQK